MQTTKLLGANGIRPYVDMYMSLMSGTQLACWKWFVEHSESPEIMLRCPRKMRGQQKACFYNAQLLAMEHEHMKYYEGLAVPPDIEMPFEHAYIVVDDKVLDPTWRNGRAYIGVHVPTSFIRAWWVEHMQADSILWHYAKDQLEGILHGV